MGGAPSGQENCGQWAQPGPPLSFQREHAHYFGYVYFRQVKDSSARRGYFQKVSRLAAPGHRWEVGAGSLWEDRATQGAPQLLGAQSEPRQL